MASGTLHITLSPSAAGLLREALESAGRRAPVVGFSDSLAHGPIDPPTPWSRLRWMTDILGAPREDWDWLPRTTRRFWRRALAPATRRIVWTSSRSAREYTSFLSLVEHMGERPFEVIDMADVEVSHSASDGQRWRDKALSLGMLEPSTIAAERLWERAAPLTADQRKALLRTWRQLRAENAPLRLVGPAGLTSAPLSAFDDALLSYTTEAWTHVGYVIGSVMAQDYGEYFQVGDEVLGSRVAHLVSTGQLEYRPPADGEENGRGYHRDGGLVAIRGQLRRAPGAMA